MISLRYAPSILAAGSAFAILILPAYFQTPLLGLILLFSISSPVILSFFPEPKKLNQFTELVNQADDSQSSGKEEDSVDRQSLAAKQVQGSEASHSTQQHEGCSKCEERSRAKVLRINKKKMGSRLPSLKDTDDGSEMGASVDMEDLGSVSSRCFSDMVANEPNKSNPSGKHVGGMVSCLELFKIGVGPSSSHTVGPMKASNVFLEELEKAQCFEQVDRVCVDFYGSLALTGVGHGTDKAVVIGLLGEKPDSVDPSKITDELEEIQTSRTLMLGRRHMVAFNMNTDIIFHKTESLPFHSNAMSLTALDSDNDVLLTKTYYSIGGGFILDDAVVNSLSTNAPTNKVTTVKYNFSSAEELLLMCKSEGISIAQAVLANEASWRPEHETRAGILKVWDVMKDCVNRGCTSDPSRTLPGFLNVKRRAPDIYRKLKEYQAIPDEGRQPLGPIEGAQYMKHLSLFALAVSEENAAGGRVVTAPTNGAAGIIPAVLHYIYTYHSKSDEDIITFFLTATAIGYLFKEGASISGAEAGCQGEVGVACSMAAAGLTAVLGGTNNQIENAAEIAMEHHLGMTCDPVGGLVQVPCIERNTMGAVKAVNSALLALHGEGEHVVSLDKVIRAMNNTAKDMQSKYKETSLGGLALEFEVRESVMHPEC